MTPTEHDKELQEQIYALDRLRVKTGPNLPRIGSVMARVDDIVALVTADRKRVASEARIATLDALDNHRKTLNYIVKDGAPRNHTNYEVYMRKAIEVDTKIAELKAQQEETK